MSWWLRRAENRVAVAPSLLAADFADLRREVVRMEEAGADLLHLDVMDGHFVPNLTFGPFIVAAVRRCSSLFLDAHLMVSRPDRFLESFARSGAGGLTIHVEADAEADVRATLRAIGELGLRRGLSLNPGTDLGRVLPHLRDLDLVLVMSVQPGFGGQAFQPVALQKVAELCEERQRHGYGYAVSIDGGVDGGTAPACRSAGADILVSGTFLFGAEDRPAAVRQLRRG